MQSITKIFHPSSVVLFGASRSETKTGGVILRNLLGSGFQGHVYPINPKSDEINGQKVYGSLDELPETPDLAVIATPAPTVPAIIEACGQRGINAAIVISAGFREAGPEGKRLEEKLVAVARSNGVRFLGPNCLGVLRPEIGLNASFSAGTAAAGRIALVSQSGALCTAILDWAASNDVRFSTVISTGISADVGFGEILDFLVEDTSTDSIMLYVEGVQDARRFTSALRSAARVKPVIVMKSGRHSQGSRAAVSHTGALLGSDDVFEAVLRRAGVVRVSSFTHFFSAATTLHVGVRTRGGRLAIVTNAGGPAVMAVDYLSEKGLDLAVLSDETIEKMNVFLPQPWSHANPVDVLGDAGPEQFSSAISTCLEDDGVDATLVILTPQAMTQPEDVAQRVVELAAKSKKPIFTSWMGGSMIASSRTLFREHNVPTYRTPEAAVESFSVVAAYHENQRLLLETPPPLAEDDPPDVEGAQMIIDSALADHREVLTLAESKALLAAFRIPVLQSIPARDGSTALLIAEEIGFPVALKIDSPDITHKSDVGGIQLNIRNARDIPNAARNLIERVKKQAPDAQVTGILVEPMASKRGGRELMIGVTSDPVFGPVITFGMGGTMVEIIRDRAIALPPLNRYLARKLIERSRASACLGEFRGTPAADLAAIEDVLLRVSEMVCELPSLRELDINPLLADEKGVVALDARIVVQRKPISQRAYNHMAIHPYPANSARSWERADGTAVTIRPIRPEDAEIERTFVNELSDQSKYYRFMHSIREITPDMLSRFTQIDYDREMAFIAVVGGPREERQVGVARYGTYPSGEACEFAVVVADEWQGKGLGTELLRELIESARDKGLARMEGIVLAENRNMLAFTAAAGFTSARDPEDMSVVRVTLEL